MKFSFRRVLCFLGGLAAAIIAMGLPVLFLSNELQESELASGFATHPKLLVISAVLMALAFASVSGYVAYRLLRFALRGAAN
jgi:hypothetical protein